MPVTGRSPSKWWTHGCSTSEGRGDVGARVVRRLIGNWFLTSAILLADHHDK
ncbi:hypothetical protein T4B_12133 [Trichinella pseudospiralis]|uniref:Uncharacterized protein n=1 Tax=Trichinella pseudospiralis TaxID=6337 RepID=A0A0V1DXI3_TRIPS|nr:hypothetical protein T4A_5385 [Trichinella pseudospiralis]KRZ19673.1 hypothetical protein T4B_12133 [Trichinella pseudospiralis]